jgi:hypothetical protein
LEACDVIKFSVDEVEHHLAIARQAFSAILNRATPQDIERVLRRSAAAAYFRLKSESSASQSATPKENVIAFPMD